MSKKERKPFSQTDYIPKRFGLKYAPPQIIIEYLTPSTGKLYHHKIRLHKFNSESKIQEVLKEIFEKHYLYLGNNKVNPNQINKLLEKIKGNYKQTKEKALSQQSTTLAKTEAKSELIANKEVKSNGNINGNKGIEIQSKAKEDNNQQEAEIEEDYNFDEFEDEDLNKLDTDELKIKKEQMDKFYDKNNIKVGDANFIYDVRKDFDNNVNYGAEWDDDSY